MKLKLDFTKSSVLFISTLVTSLGIAASPSIAASFARSEADFTIFNYSQSPEGLPESGDVSQASTEFETSVSATGILTSTKANTSVKGGTTIANAYANAIFLKTPPFSNNSTLSYAVGSSNSYFGFAQSQATVAGEFSIKAGETFSFEFVANLAMLTAVENPLEEIATATGDLSLVLFDSTNNAVLDFFTVLSKIATSAHPRESADFFDYQNSQNINIDPNPNNFNTSFGNSNQESVTASFIGSYQRSFQSDTRLILIETKTSQVNVKAPEPSNTLALLLGFGLTGAFLGAKSKLNRQGRLFSTEIGKV
ncbi:MAG TPA: hypothetical protein DDW76_00720 [Cyanobacteria bacterium UBA11369]|nr:hypothetical protein [Cyanobacteria bacterium UBA11368]HBE47358.1 hypothetical protein [Cyanobacteria bacterium UBA11369]